MRKILLTLLTFLSMGASSMAHEGMWLPSLLKQLNEADMQKNGFKLTAEDVYSLNKSSMKDAVVWFGRGCTGEVVSDKGLVLTNHHCGFGQIQSHSSLEHDYLTDGFVAKGLPEELPNPGLSVSFVVRIDDVTGQVLKGVTEQTPEAERQKLIAQNTARVEAEATKGTHYNAQTKPFFYGNQYYMFVMETFNDVRLVYAPPSSIGKFGGDTDNWMWPRHTGDFSVFRIYAGKDNKPAAYSPDNVPYKPRHHFPVSLAGVKAEDFTMVYGFPGTTRQYVPSFAVDYVQNLSNPVRIKMRDNSLELIGKASDKDALVRIQYAAKQASIANAWKKWQGENLGLQRLDVVSEKRAQEAAFAQRAASNAAYAALLPQLQQRYADIAKYNLASDLFLELNYYGPEILNFSARFTRLITEYDKLKQEGKLEKAIADAQAQADGFYKNYNPALDQQIFSRLSAIYAQAIAPEFLPAAFKTAQQQPQGFERLASRVYGKSIFAKPEQFKAMLAKFDAKAAHKLAKDPAFMLNQQIQRIFLDEVRPTYARSSQEIDQLLRQYVKASMELFPNKNYWSDANSTLRVTYGKVEGSEPADGVSYKHYTTLEGVLAKRVKDVPATDEFYVSPKLMELHAKKDYGRYGQDGQLMVCFTGSNHTTGGNSGSPVLNAQGQLIGINFDRTWESTMSDLRFDPERCRNIAVDIRYVLFVMDKLSGAGHLVDEMTLVQQQ